MRIVIETPKQLRSVGAEEAFIQIRTHVDSGVCLNMLYGIQGAIENIPDNEDVKQNLKIFYKSLKK